jgi:hypothetical protein
MTTVSIEGCGADEAIRTGCVRSLYYVVSCIMLGISESFVVMCGLRLGTVGTNVEACLLRGELVEVPATVSSCSDGSHHVECWCDEVWQENETRGVEKSPRGARRTIANAWGVSPGQLLAPEKRWWVNLSSQSGTGL